MENKKQQTNEDTERRQHNTSDKPGNGNGRTAEGRDRIYAPCNNSEEGLRRPLYSGRRNPLPSCCANTHTHTPNTHAHQHAPSSLGSPPSSPTVCHSVMFCHNQQSATFTSISKSWCIAWTHVRF